VLAQHLALQRAGILGGWVVSNGFYKKCRNIARMRKLMEITVSKLSEG